MKPKFNVIDLFCGCGGLSKGFEQAGFHVLLGIDFEQSALDTFEKNHTASKAIRLDLSQDEAFEVIDASLNGQTVDVIIGGPPCQGFSLTGPRNFEDKRNELYLAVFKAVKKYSPQAFRMGKILSPTRFCREVGNPLPSHLKTPYNLILDV